jgi:hypothetical protein
VALGLGGNCVDRNDLEVTSPERSRTIRWRPTRFQIFRYTIYAVLTANLFYYLWEDIVAFRYLDPGATLGEILEAFAVTIDYVAWMILIALFELETDFIPKEKLKGTLKWLFNGLLVACYVVLVYAFWGYVAGLVGSYEFEAFPPEEVCSLVNENYAWVTKEDRVAELTRDNCGASSDGEVFKSPTDKLVASRDVLSAVIWLGWIDVVNAGVWLLVVLFMEWEVMLELRGALTKRRLIVLKTIKGTLYLILLGDAIYWHIYGAFIDYWDAYLWLLAFVMIDLNIFKWDDKAGEESPVPSAA